VSIKDIILAAASAPKEPNFWMSADYYSSYTYPQPSQQKSNMAVSANGNVLSWSIGNIDSAYESVAVFRDIDGNLLWKKRFDISGYNKNAKIGAGAVDDSDNCYISLSANPGTGYYYFVQVFKYNKQGSLIWSKQIRPVTIGGTLSFNSPVQSVIHTDGNLYILVSGYYGYDAAVLLSLTNGGVYRFATAFTVNSQNPFVPYSLSVSGTSIVVAGYKGVYARTTTSGSIASGIRYLSANTTWTPNGVKLNPDGSFYITGARDSTTGAIVVKVGADEGVLAQVSLGPSSGNLTFPLSVDVGADGNLYMGYSSTVRTGGNFDYGITSLTSSLTHRFTSMVYGTVAASGYVGSVHADTANRSFYVCIPTYVSAANGYANILIKGKSDQAAVYKTFQPVAGNTISYNPVGSPITATAVGAYTGPHGIYPSNVTGYILSEAVAETVVTTDTTKTLWSAVL